MRLKSSYYFTISFSRSILCFNQTIIFKINKINKVINFSFNTRINLSEKLYLFILDIY